MPSQASSRPWCHSKYRCYRAATSADLTEEYAMRIAQQSAPKQPTTWGALPSALIAHSRSAFNFEPDVLWQDC